MNNFFTQLRILNSLNVMLPFLFEILRAAHMIQLYVKDLKQGCYTQIYARAKEKLERVAALQKSA